MSGFESTPFNCPACGRTFQGATAESVNAARMPAERERILAGEFHALQCPHCGQRIRVDRPFLYTDLERRQFAHVFTREEIAEWPEREEEAERVFHEGFESAPPAVREMASGFAVRAVFGVDALAEKLRLWDAGLDDAIVELLKLELLTTVPELSGRRDLYVTAVAVDDEFIEVEVGARDEAEPAFYGMRRSRYDELEAERGALIERFPGLFHRPYVSYRRLARERVEA